MKRSVIAVLLFVIISSCWAENARLFIPFACAFPRTIITNEHFSLSGGLYSHGFWLGGYDEAAFILPVNVLPMSAFEYDEFIRRNTSGKAMSVELRAEYSFLQVKKFLLSLYGNIIFQHWRFHSREPKSVSFYGEYIGWVNFFEYFGYRLGVGAIGSYSFTAHFKLLAGITYFYAEYASCDFDGKIYKQKSITFFERNTDTLFTLLPLISFCYQF